MKSLEELRVIRDRVRANLHLRQENPNSIRVLVGMATCGIAAGAKDVLNAFVEEVNKRNLDNITITQTGCIGNCQFEPIVEILEQGKEKVTYIEMTPEKVIRVVNDHLVGSNVVTEYTINTNQ